MTPSTFLQLFLAGSAVLSLSGCWGGMIKPAELTPLVTSSQIDAPDGGRLGLAADGTLLHYPALDDIEAALGCSLEPEAEGLRVTQRLIAETPLLEDDLIVGAAPVKPGFALGKLGAAEHVRDSGHDVRVIADLAGYTRMPTELVLRVERVDEETTARFTVGAPRVLAQQLWRPDLTREIGFTGCLLSTVFPSEAATSDMLLVTWVAEGGEAARLGLRPLSRVFGVSEGSDLEDALAHLSPTRHDVSEDPDDIGLDSFLFNGLEAPDDPIHVDILGGGMGFMSVQTDNVDMTLVTLGPLGTVLSYKTDSKLAPEYGDYLTTTTWSTVGFQSTSTEFGDRQARGERSEISFLASVDSLATLDNGSDDSMFYFFPEGE